VLTSRTRAVIVSIKVGLYDVPTKSGDLFSLDTTALFTGLYRLELVLVAATAAVDELQTSVGYSIVVQHRQVG